MERLKKALYRLIFPGAAVVIISAPVAAALLIYTFMFANENSPIAYISYVFSAYSLTILCVQIVRIVRYQKSTVKATLHKNKFIDRYLTDVPFRMKVSLYLSFSINMLYTVMKFVSGLYYHSVWFGTLAVYYFLLALMRFLLLRHAKRGSFGKEQITELKKYRVCGWILMVMNIALSGVVVLVLSQNEGFEYAGYLIYIMAMYAFYTVIIAMINVVKYRKYNSPVMSAAKIINLVAALVSMLSLETAMLAQFDNGQNPETFRKLMTGATGSGVCLTVLALAVFMIVSSTKQLNKLKNNIAQ